MLTLPSGRLAHIEILINTEKQFCENRLICWWSISGEESWSEWQIDLIRQNFSSNILLIPKIVIIISDNLSLSPSGKTSQSLVRATFLISPTYWLCCIKLNLWSIYPSPWLDCPLRIPKHQSMFCLCLVNHIYHRPQLPLAKCRDFYSNPPTGLSLSFIGHSPTELYQQIALLCLFCLSVDIEIRTANKLSWLIK